MPSAILDHDGPGPLAKRQKLTLTDGNVSSNAKQRAACRIFAPFRVSEPSYATPAR